MKFYVTRFPRNNCELGLRQAVDEEPAIRFREHAGVENRHESAIGGGADEPTYPLAKLDQRIGQRELVERVSTAITNVIAARFGDRMRRRIEREARDDHLGERVA